MKKYLVEFEFKSNVGNCYWFPLYIDAENSTLAEDTANAVNTALKEHYTVIRKTSVRLLIKGMNSELMEEYINQQMQGQITRLNLRVWNFEKIHTIPELNFEQHLQLVEFTEDFSGEVIASTIAEKKFPVRLYYKGSEMDFKEYLLINVVNPLNIEEFYIVVEINDKFYNESRLFEGIWKDAHLKGYKVRVDAPHTADGKRHVHIAHSKHTSAKTKQVSWNDDQTRHDKKTFDHNFKGLERAKEIARKELGLDDNALLEHVQMNINPNLLLESFKVDFDESQIIYFKL